MSITVTQAPGSDFKGTSLAVLKCAKELFTDMFLFSAVFILASVSFWPLLIIESMARVSQHVLLMYGLLVKQENVKGELDCFNCRNGVFFSDYSL